MHKYPEELTSVASQNQRGYADGIRGWLFETQRAAFLKVSYALAPAAPSTTFHADLRQGLGLDGCTVRNAIVGQLKLLAGCYGAIFAALVASSPRPQALLPPNDRKNVWGALVVHIGKGWEDSRRSLLGIAWSLRGRGKHEDGASGVAMTAKVSNVPTFEGAGLDYPI